jgi:hypothetical protein
MLWLSQFPVHVRFTEPQHAQPLSSKATPANSYNQPQPLDLQNNSIGVEGRNKVTKDDSRRAKWCLRSPRSIHHVSQIRFV